MRCKPALAAPENSSPIEHYGVEPDLIITAKSLGGGLPLAAVTGRADIMDAPGPGGLGSTFAGNPASCAAHWPQSNCWRKKDCLPGPLPSANGLKNAPKGWQKKWEIIGDVRGLGGMCAFELVRNRATREPADTETKELAHYCYENGLITITAGTYNNVMRILVPLVITDEQLDEALDGLESGIAHVFGAKTRRSLPRVAALRC